MISHRHYQLRTNNYTYSSKEHWGRLITTFCQLIVWGAIKQNQILSITTATCGEFFCVIRLALVCLVMLTFFITTTLLTFYVRSSLPRMSLVITFNCLGAEKIFETCWCLREGCCLLHSPHCKTFLCTSWSSRSRQLYAVKALYVLPTLRCPTNHG